ncbi:MAG: enolase C-terminal domain-like protein [Verrucomicrobiales bacterium]
MAEFFYWRYLLRLAGAGGLNAQTPDGEIEGVLLRDQAGGHACLQPWPSLGQGSLEQNLALLRDGGDSGLLAAAKRCLAMDGEARAAGIALFDGKSVPPSHLSVPPWADISWLDENFSSGFTLFKLKCGRDLLAEGSRIEQLCRHFGDSLRLRLDFNGCLEPEGLRQFVGLLGHRLAQVDFIEDPLPYEERVWGELSDALSVDLAVDQAGASAQGGFKFRVFKPAWEPAPDSSACVVTTSAMDHPLGQLFAAHEAAVSKGKSGAAGLLTHWLFEPNSFSECLGVDGLGRLEPPGGLGLGFDGLLDALPWRSL